MAAKRDLGHKLFLMPWFLESLQQCNHWTFQSTWSHSWHVLKEGSNKMPPTCIIRQHRKLLYKQNPWHESKLWQFYSDGEKMKFFLSPHCCLTSLSRFGSGCGPALCCSVTCQVAHQQLCNRSNPDGSIHWVALGDPLTAHRGVAMADKQKADHKLCASTYFF